jgi:hypothetical protein
VQKRTTADDASRAGPAGGAEEGEEEADHSKGGVSGTAVDGRAAHMEHVYQGFGPTLAAEYLNKKHDLEVGRETVRQWMLAAKLWRAQPKRVEKVHQWRARGSRW